MKSCPCGSGEYRRELLDARGNFCTFVCDKCEADRRQEFRPDIFSNPVYLNGEPAEDD
jgi:hypothetical protein